MKTRLRAVVLIVGLVQLLGCDEGAKDSGHGPSQTTPAIQTESPHPDMAHRFVLVEHHTDVAFDTLTGQLCRTWDWSLTGATNKPDPVTGNFPQRAPGELTPTCLSLYEQNPKVVIIPDRAPGASSQAPVDCSKKNLTVKEWLKCQGK
jgi:hypothetical protein